jgi:hypothetical protein
VNQHDRADQPRYQTAAVAYHEAIPGHHLQLTIAGELENVPCTKVPDRIDLRLCGKTGVNWPRTGTKEAQRCR